MTILDLSVIPLKIHIKGDERILGDSDFVEKVLSQVSEQMELRYRLKAEGWTLTKITERVAEIFGIEKDQVVIAGKQPDRVRARGVLAYWAIRDLGLTATEIGKYLSQGGKNRCYEFGTFEKYWFYIGKAIHPIILIQQDYLFA